MMSSRLSLPICVLLALGGATPAFGQSAAAILVDVEGAMQPQLPPGTELAPGQTLALTSRATLNFVHYGACEFVRVFGGSLTIREKDYELTGGMVVQTERASCPTSRRRALQRGNEASGVGGLRLRNVSAQQIQTQPRIILTGAAATDIVAVEVLELDRTLIRLKVEREQAVWPSELPPLRPGAHYTFRFIRRQGEATVLTALTSGNLTSDARVPAVFAIE
jgi:hypothetical protein